MPPASSDNLLSASSLAKFIASSLTPDAAPQLKSPTDAIALACHAGMLAVGFKLVGLGEDDRIGASNHELYSEASTSAACKTNSLSTDDGSALLICYLLLNRGTLRIRDSTTTSTAMERFSFLSRFPLQTHSILYGLPS